ncbi:hypothetical protein F4777DRAFT_27836 [Nemania sp. FL0916]|nr:hypothetical protein F4777DRAFT_27836 [Nemania sp. FL0916]
MSTSAVANFSQQGSVDWVKLANAPVNLTVGVLSRLSRARLEAITYHAALLIFRPAELSDQGQIRVYDAIKKTESFPSLNKALWFGFGIKHIIHDFAESREGLACVGMCAALNEYFNIHSSSGIISELWKMKKLPQDYTPALHQWSALIEACSGVLSATEFPLILGQILNQYHRNVLGTVRTSRTASSSESVAEVLHTVFEASKRDITEVHITGNRDCAWVAAVVHWLLKMEVEIIDDSGTICWASSHKWPSSEGYAKLIVYQDFTPSNRPEIVKKYHVLNGGRRLLSLSWDEETCDQPIGLGRVPWETCLGDTFGISVRELLSNYGGIVGRCLGLDARIFENCMCINGEKSSWAESAHPSAAITARKFALATRDLLPEIRANNEILESMEEMIERKLQDEKMEYETQLEALRTACACSRCRRESQHAVYEICMLQFIKFLPGLVRLLSTIQMPKNLSILPSVAGMEQLYRQHPDPLTHFESEQIFDHESIIHLSILLFCPSPQNIYAQMYNESRTSAMSAGGLCFYLNTLCNPTGPPDEASLLHVVPGRIHFNNFTYETIEDDRNALDQRGGFYVQSARAISSYKDVVASSTEGLDFTFNVAETATNSKILYSNYQISQKNRQGIIKFGIRELYTEICNAYSADDCQGKTCQTPDGIESIWTDGAGYISTGIIPAGRAPIVRALPNQALEILIALTQQKLANSGPLSTLLQKQLQGNQCIRCCLSGVINRGGEGGRRDHAGSFGPMTRNICILTDLRGIERTAVQDNSVN